MTTDTRLPASLRLHGLILLGMAFIFGGGAGNAQQQANGPILPGIAKKAEAPPASQVPRANADEYQGEQKKTEIHLYSAKFVKANELATLISAIYRPGNRLGPNPDLIRLTVDESSNRLLVAAPNALWQEIETLLQKLDVLTSVDRGDGQKLMVMSLKGLSGQDRFLREALNMLFDKNSNAKYAIDQAQTSLIVYGDERARLLVEALCAKLQTLSETPKPTRSEQAPPAPSMQIRVLWLVDSEKKEIGSALSGDVLSISPALAKLGISHPRLVGNSLVNTSGGMFTSLGKTMYESEVFLRLNGSCRLAGNQPRLQIDLRIDSQEIPRDPEQMKSQALLKSQAQLKSLAQLETEIQAPFGHYVILGMTPTTGTTSVFVVQVTVAE